MPKSKRQLRVVIPALERSEDRSTLFWWMLDHHEEMTAAATGRRPRWRQLCERFAELALKDGNGEPVSPEAARRTWRHVREFVASSGAEALRKPKRKPPSRISPDWRPRVVSPAPTPVAGSQEHEIPETPEEVIARLRRSMAGR